MIGLQHPGRAELKDIDFQLFEKYKDYLLGDFCYGLSKVQRGDPQECL